MRKPSGEFKEDAPDSFQIAIDGTVSSGKGTVAQSISEKLDILYVDTGAMYRCVALLALRTNTDPANEDKLVENILANSIQLRRPLDNEKDGRLITVLLGEEDVSWQIRAEDVGVLTSVTAQHPRVREEMVLQQQRIAAAQDVVMEGRDITHKVLPNAQLKIFLDADPRVRAWRRYKELQTRGTVTTFEDVLKDLQDRDQRDFEKNLKRVPGVWDIDTSFLTAEEVLNQILERAKLLRSAAHE